MNMQNDINILPQYICEIKNYYFTRNMFSVCLMYDFYFEMETGFYKTKHLSAYVRNIYTVQLKNYDLKKVHLKNRFFL